MVIVELVFNMESTMIVITTRKIIKRIQQQLANQPHKISFSLPSTNATTRCMFRFIHTKSIPVSKVKSKL
ncbi:hypothetical protein ACH3XW_46375 [Acanthocheilonema viteae]